MQLLCRHCHNPIEAVALNLAHEILRPSCGSTVRLDKGSTVTWPPSAGPGWHAAKLSLTELWGWQERGWFCCAAFREIAMQPGQPVVTTPVRALVQTGNLQPRASARSAAFERSFFGRPYGRGWGLRPSEPRAHARGHIEGASSLRVRGSRDRNGQQNRDDLEPTARPSFHHPRARHPGLVRAGRDGRHGRVRLGVQGPRPRALSHGGDQEHGVVHREIKPSNILRDEQGKPQQPVL